MEINEHIRHLLEKYRQNTITKAEYLELLGYFDIDSEAGNAYQLLHAAMSERPDTENIQQKRVDEITEKAHIQLQKRIGQHKSNRLIRILPYAAAVILISLTTYYFIDYRVKNDESTQLTAQAGEDLPPGTNRAVLSFGGQETIDLSEDQQGLINDNSTIRYSDGTAIRSLEQVQVATVSTPVAGQYQVQLPDGSRAWLNASSSISYPTEFLGDQRKISVTGEVFLEVIKNTKQPFIVATIGQEIEVLGTSFNINTYADKGKLYTTLTEGSLKITSTGNNSSVILKPGNQALISEDATITVLNVDTDEISSWKEGFYLIKNQSLALFGKQIQRWYDVEVDMGTKGGIQLSALIPRDVNLSELLQAIELKTGIRFKIQGRRVTVID